MRGRTRTSRRSAQDLQSCLNRVGGMLPGEKLMDVQQAGVRPRTDLARVLDDGAQKSRQNFPIRLGQPYTYTSKHGVKENFNSSGALTAIVHQHNRASTFLYCGTF